MYLLEITPFVRQIMPPHWRSTYREAVLMVLLWPVFAIERRFSNYRYNIGNAVNRSAQVVVFQEALRQVSDSRLSEISEGAFSVVLKVPQGTALTPIYKLANTYIPTGVKWTIKYINN